MERIFSPSCCEAAGLRIGRRSLEKHASADESQYAKGQDGSRDQGGRETGRDAAASAEGLLTHQLRVRREAAQEGKHQQQHRVERLGENKELDQRTCPGPARPR
jgi:hypothetical protein